MSDIGAPDILHHLLTRDARDPACSLVGNHLDNDVFKTRMLRTDQPREVPWDAFGVDAVVDATARFRTRADMQAHLDNGAGRVLISALPLDHIDRVVIPGINEADAKREDRMICAGSGSTTAMALVLKVLSSRFDIALATMTSVHAYTSDQSLQDYAGPDYRRSRSGAENIIPNVTDAPRWVAHVLPMFAGKLSGYALNVPVQKGSLLDLTVAFEDADVDVADVNAAMVEAAAHAAVADRRRARSDRVLRRDRLSAVAAVRSACHAQSGPTPDQDAGVARESRSRRPDSRRARALRRARRGARAGARA